MNVLGISCFYHDSSACLVRDGEIVAAAQEERFCREKNTGKFPIEALNFCVQQGGVLFSDVDYIAYFEKPYLKFARSMIDHLESWPFSHRSFLRKMPVWLEERLFLSETIGNELGYEGKILYLKHHLSHAASAFLPSPFEQAAILTVDGVGEWATLTAGVGKGSKITIGKEVQYPSSIGLLYTAATVFLGFGPNGEEGKTMGLAGYGEPRFLPEFRKILHLFSDGSFRLDPSYFDFRRGERMWSRKWEQAFGSPRKPHDDYSQRDKDLAASLQAAVEEALVNCARALQKETGFRKLALAGGVTLNCLANAKILEQTDFDEIFVQPAAGDAGGALGAALYVQHSLLNLPRKGPLRHAYLGPEFNEREMERSLKRARLSYSRLSDEDLYKLAAEQIWRGKIVGWFQGRMEFGPRALGNRSILGNPCRPETQALINEKVKDREKFQPFAPVVLEERAAEFFKMSSASPFMLLAPQAREESAGAIPAVIHVDGTARVQTVDQDSNLKLRNLISAFERLSGVPVLLNTSFNGRGEPLVCTPDDAVSCFLKNGIDLLVMGNFAAGRQPL